MNRVGEWVWRSPSGLSLPRAASDPPITVICGDAFLTAGYDVSSSAKYAFAAASTPPRAELGQPEAVRVRLVAEAHVPQLRDRAHE